MEGDVSLGGSPPLWPCCLADYMISKHDKEGPLCRAGTVSRQASHIKTAIHTVRTTTLSVLVTDRMHDYSTHKQ